jgi:chemotaxis protein MotB
VKPSPIYEEIVRAVSQDDEVDIRPEEDGAKITLSNTLLFHSGSTEISQRGISALQKIANFVEMRPEISVVVCGHTDDNPIQGRLKELYPSNWELSAARGLVVLHTLVRLGVSASQCEVRAFGQYKPNDENPDDKGLNRRVEIFLKESDQSWGVR